MTLTELRYAVALADTQHFGRAAERCHVSQSTLSVGIKRLEDDLGVALFERARGAVQLTPIGHSVVERAQRVLVEANGVLELAHVGRNQLGSSLRIGAIYTIGPYLFPHLIPQLHTVAPQMPLYIEENFTHVLRERLREGELDAIIVALPFTEPDVLTKVLYDEALCVLLPAEHPLAAEQRLSADALEDAGLLILGEGHCFRERVLEVCPATQRASVESSSLETIRHMVASGLGVSVLPHSAVSGHHYSPGSVAIRHFSAPVPFRQVAIAWRASFPRPRAIDVLADSVRLCSVSRGPNVEV
ncbi:transcriptional regulator [Pseudomonas tohonis]|uniref:Transcriptional regulator n=1 Tax=Pseudomonas tohonis TaxID=2725477 RepID=A0A6J4E5R6_9PSED|nr:hydrogen peroxide-inducible genes activator [Pseudomonas tohonis]BCG24639.1 transcriptional regulator [Pseudomonas tohonis]GJN52002.1 transcriptional regulator [Pseudomonas tohonis]